MRVEPLFWRSLAGKWKAILGDLATVITYFTIEPLAKWIGLATLADFASRWLRWPFLLIVAPITYLAIHAALSDVQKQHDQEIRKRDEEIDELKAYDANQMNWVNAGFQSLNDYERGIIAYLAKIGPIEMYRQAFDPDRDKFCVRMRTLMKSRLIIETHDRHGRLIWQLNPNLAQELKYCCRRIDPAKELNKP